MLLLAHLGIGLKMARTYSRDLPLKGILAGTVFPDILDKALYYGLSLTSANEGSNLGVIRGTRTLGHTFLLCLSFFICFIARKFFQEARSPLHFRVHSQTHRRSLLLKAFSVGIATHLILDALSNYSLGIVPLSKFWSLSSWSPFFWPLSGWTFPTAPFHNLAEHLSLWRNPFTYSTEMLGLVLLLLEWRRGKRYGI